MEASERLDPAVRGLVRLSAALVIADEEVWREALTAAARHARDVEIEEVLLQAHLFVGFPVALNAFGVWRELAGERRGTGAAEGGEAAAGARVSDRARKGEALCRAVYADVYERLRGHVRGLHPALDRWMVEDGYGRTLARRGLSVEIRELCIVALLAAGGHERQLRGHLRGALNVGASRGWVEAALGIGIEAARETRAGGGDPDRAWKMWAEVSNREERRPCSST